MRRTSIAVLVLLAVVGFGVQNSAARRSYSCNPYCKTLCYEIVRDGTTDSNLSATNRATDGNIPTYLKIDTGCDFLQWQQRAYSVNGMIWLERVLDDGSADLATVILDGTLQKAGESWALYLDGRGCPFGSSLDASLYFIFDDCPLDSGYFASSTDIILERTSCSKLPDPVTPTSCKPNE